MPDFFVGRLDTLPDDFGRVLSALVEAVFQCRDRWRQDENADRFGKQATDLSRTLLVDFQQGVMTCTDLVENGQFRCAIVVSVNDGVFEKFVCVKPFPEIVDGREVIFAAVFFSWAWRTGRVGYGQTQCRVIADQRCEQR